jgi:hypothetical protein
LRLSIEDLCRWAVVGSIFVVCHNGLVSFLWQGCGNALFSCGFHHGWHPARPNWFCCTVFGGDCFIFATAERELREPTVVAIFAAISACLMKIDEWCKWKPPNSGGGFH